MKDITLLKLKFEDIMILPIRKFVGNYQKYSFYPKTHNVLCHSDKGVKLFDIFSISKKQEMIILWIYKQLRM